MKETLAQKIKVWYYFFSTQLKDTKMEAHGDEDMVAEPTDRELELALEEVVETILDCSMWPMPKKVSSRGRSSTSTISCWNTATLATWWRCM
jgi:hypothetical protein